MGYYLTEQMTEPAATRTAGGLPYSSLSTPLAPKNNIGAPFCSTILSTKYWDSDTKTLAYQLRDYGPGIGGWLSRDLIGELGCENLYVFVYNEPISDYDEFGLQRGGGGRVRCRFAELPPRAMREDPTYAFAQRYTQAQVNRLRDLLNEKQCCRGSESELRTLRQEANRVIERFEGPSIRSANPTPETIKQELQEFCETQRQAADLMTRGSRLSTQCQAPNTGRRATRSQRDELFDNSRDESGVPRCSYCGETVTRTPGRPESFQADHVTPWCQGGQTTPWNLAGSCRTCNTSKGGRTIDQWVLPPSGQNVVCNVRSP